MGRCHWTVGDRHWQVLCQGTDICVICQLCHTYVDIVCHLRHVYGDIVCQLRHVYGDILCQLCRGYVAVVWFVNCVMDV